MLDVEKMIKKKTKLQKMITKQALEIAKQADNEHTRFSLAYLSVEIVEQQDEDWTKELVINLLEEEIHKLDNVKNSVDKELILDFIEDIYEF